MDSSSGGRDGATGGASADRLVSLRQLAAELLRARTPEQVGRVIVDAGVAALGASGGSVVVPAPDGAELLTLAASGFLPDIVARWHRFPLRPPTPVGEAYRTGDPVVLPSIEAILGASPHLHHLVERGNQAIVAVPLQDGDRTLGTLGLVFDRPLDADAEIGFVTALAQQCALALDRAASYASVVVTRSGVEANLDSAADMIYMVDADLRVTRANAACRAFFAGRGSATPATLADLVAALNRDPPGEPAAVRALRSQTVAEEQRTTDGRRFDVRAAPIRGRVARSSARSCWDATSRTRCAWSRSGPASTAHSSPPAA